MLKKLPSLVFSTLFGGIFIIAGIAAFWFSTGQAIAQYFESRSWQTVHANITQVKINSAQTSVTANYRYQYQGIAYTSNNVSLYKVNDNIGDYWKKLYKRLKKDRKQNTVIAWINPKQPEQALLDKTFRWGMLAFGSVFLLLFSGFGILMLISTNTEKSKKVNQEEKLENIAKAQNGIESNEKNASLFWFSFSLPFLLLSIPFISELKTEINKQEYGALIVLAFPIAGLFMLRAAIKTYRLYKQIGPTRFYMDPLPGAIGGELGGYFDIAHYRTQEPTKVMLSCIHKNYSNSKENNNDRIIWQEEITAYSKATAEGSRYVFVLNIPDNLPPTGSETVTRGNIEWEVSATTALSSRIKKPVKFDRTWTIPVYQSEQTLPIQSSLSRAIPTSHKERVAHDEKIFAEKSAQEQILIAKQIDGYHIISPRGRSTSMAIIMTIFGLIFLGVGLGMVYGALTNMAIMWLFAVIFTPIGLLITIGGIDLFGRSRVAIFNRNNVQVIKYWFGIALFSRKDTVTSPEDLYIKETMSSSHGHTKVERYHAIYAKCQNKKLKIAEGVKGKKTAEALLENLRKQLF